MIPNFDVIIRKIQTISQAQDLVKHDIQHVASQISFSATIKLFQMHCFSIGGGMFHPDSLAGLRWNYAVGDARANSANVHKYFGLNYLPNY